MSFTLVRLWFLFVFLFLGKYSAENTELLSVLKYNLVQNDKVQLVLSGIEYGEAGKTCLIRKATDISAGFVEINSCPESDATHGAVRCLRPCSGENNQITFDKLSPKTKYIYVSSGDDASIVKDQTKGGRVFGLSIVLLVNPIINISTENTSQRLKLQTSTCPSVDCPIYYKDVKYAGGDAGSVCTATNNNNDVEFNRLLPYYEMRCTDLPSFYYTMPNAYMKNSIEIYKPQYYITYTDNSKTKYLLKFSNAFPTEMCLFSIKDAANNADDLSKTYVSECGSTEAKCYSLCKNVELVLPKSKPIVKILIQTRHHMLEETTGLYEGYEYTKFAIMEPTSIEKILKDPIPEGITLDAAPYNPADINGKFQTCDLKHFHADKPNPLVGTNTNCANGQCNSDCGTEFKIVGLKPGLTYIIEISPTPINNYPGFKEYLFFRTDKSPTHQYADTVPTQRDVTINVTAVNGEKKIDINEPTCSYFVSKAYKEMFEEAQCEDALPCRGFCRDTQKLTNLTPNTMYDIQVVSNADYGIKRYAPITTMWSSLSLSYQFQDKGFKVIGQLNGPYPEAICHYKIAIRSGKLIQQVFSCPDTTPRTDDEFLLHSTVRSSGFSLNTEISASSAILTFPPCDTVPLCSDIDIGDGYDADEEYHVRVTAVDRSKEEIIDIPKNPLPENPNNVEKQIVVQITRSDETLTIKSTLPEGTDENSKCKWILRNSSDASKFIVHKCDTDLSNACAFPLCTSFIIHDIKDSNDYHLTVILADDESVYGVSEIKQGEGSNKSMILAIFIPMGIMLIVFGIYLCFWRKKETPAL